MLCRLVEVDYVNKGRIIARNGRRFTQGGALSIARRSLIYEFPFETMKGHAGVRKSSFLVLVPSDEPKSYFAIIKSIVRLALHEQSKNCLV